MSLARRTKLSEVSEFPASADLGDGRWLQVAVHQIFRAQEFQSFDQVTGQLPDRGSGDCPLSRQLAGQPVVGRLEGGVAELAIVDQVVSGVENGTQMRMQQVHCQRSLRAEPDENALGRTI